MQVLFIVQKKEDIRKNMALLLLFFNCSDGTPTLLLMEPKSIKFKKNKNVKIKKQKQLKKLNQISKFSAIESSNHQVILKYWLPHDGASPIGV